MNLTTTLLNGETITLDTNASAVTGLGAPVVCSVLLFDGTELEVSGGEPEAADFFLSTTGSSTGAPVRLRGGHDLVTGPYGGRVEQGTAFRVDVDGRTLFGVAPPSMTREALAAALADAGIGSGRRGPRMRPTATVRWSPQRSHDLAVSATDADGHAVLLDVRRTVTGPGEGPRGRRVRGGWLSRSAPAERVHVVLETDDVIAYGLPPTEEDLPLAVDVLSELEVTVEDGS